MLASAAVGTIEYRSMTEPIRVTNPNIDNYIEGKAVGIDVENQQLTIQLTAPSMINAGGEETDANQDNTFQLSYDHLVCGVGTSVSRTATSL